MSESGVAYLAARGRATGNVLAALDMLGRQAPAPDAPPSNMPMQDTLPTPAQAAPASPRQRIVLSWGPRADVVTIGLEVAPEWDLEQVWTVPKASALDLLPVLKALTKVKDLTGLTVQPPQPYVQMLTREPKRALGPEAVSPDATLVATDPCPARGQPPGPKPHAGRGRKNRPADPAVELGGTAHGPGSSEPGEALVSGPAASVPEAE